MNYFIHYALGLFGLLFVLTGITELVLLYDQPLYAVYSVISIALSIWFMERMRRHCAEIHYHSKVAKYRRAYSG